jgi:hypothetical protein
MHFFPLENTVQNSLRLNGSKMCQYFFPKLAIQNFGASYGLGNTVFLIKLTDANEICVYWHVLISSYGK